MSRTFQLIISDGSNGGSQILHINQNGLIEELIEKISNVTGISAANQRVIFNGQILQTGRKKLSDYKIHDRSLLFVNVVAHANKAEISDLKQKYGSSVKMNVEVPKHRNLRDGIEESSEQRKVYGSNVELSTAPDMITWDDDPDSPRTKMPCGHTIGPESLTAYCKKLLSDGKYNFFCPYKDPRSNTQCGKIWEYHTVRELGVLTDDEKKEFETMISKNYMQRDTGMQKCPKCYSFCIRKSKKDRRVRCLLCSKGGPKYEFCWYCLGKWKRALSLFKCGNSSCSREDPRLKILRETPRKEILGLNGCPSTRACPQCGILISHVQDCQHMSCVCGQQFCFICLKKAVDGEYTCCSYESHCTIAPIQDVIPGTSNNGGLCIIQ